MCLHEEWLGIKFTEKMTSVVSLVNVEVSDEHVLKFQAPSNIRLGWALNKQSLTFLAYSYIANPRIHMHAHM